MFNRLMYGCNIENELIEAGQNHPQPPKNLKESPY